MDHICSDNNSRWPQEYQQLSLDEKKRRFVAGFDVTVKRATGNPRLGVPHFYRPKGQAENEGEIQLLLPFSCSPDRISPPFLAVALAYVTDPEYGPYYSPKTILPMSIAFSNSRLLGPIDQPWLSQCMTENQIDMSDASSVSSIESFSDVSSIEPSNPISQFSIARGAKKSKEINPSRKPREFAPNRRAECYNCGEVGHKKINCPKNNYRPN